MVDDPRAARTRALLRAALLAECTGRSLDEVSVAALVRRAGVGRATFYLHYQDLRSLAVDACAQVVTDAVEALHAWRGVPDPSSAPAALVQFFEEVGAHAQLYRALLAPSSGGPLGARLRHELSERSASERRLAGAPEPELVGAAVAGAFTGVLADWLGGVILGAPDEVANRSWRLLLAMHRVPLG
ncbi:TetR/AcrR family transcriptional regulator [Streptomyces sp. NPDC006879]|uniref:TetR/AcrR family transcriptional regulator n=1 Tax=Streptomyces sp. NPDC006879 TaxID=3364767 RepID=UPI00368C0F3D